MLAPGRVISVVGVQVIEPSYRRTPLVPRSDSGFEVTERTSRDVLGPCRKKSRDVLGRNMQADSTCAESDYWGFPCKQ
jgi:hypothetical protein